jgi:lysyl-tRNA synthetase class 2
MSQQFIEHRREKLRNLREAGVLAYAERFETTHTVREALALEPGQKARIAGRLMSMRKFGKLSFAHLRDRSGKGQISFKKPELSDEVKLILSNLDIGDFVGIEGTTWVTKKGEPTLNVEKLTFLSKSMMPLPDKFSGLKDQEAIYRQRYLDILMNDGVQDRFVLRSKVIRTIRSFLDSHDFMEVETPILQAASSGAAARPFETEHHALKETLYMRISPETYLKRLVAGGLERVYELGKNFRNEGTDRSHLQEFTMLEWYAGYWDYRDNMRFIQALIRHVLQETLGTTAVEYQGQTLDFGAEWKELDYREAVLEETGVDIMAHETYQSLAADIETKCPSIPVGKAKSIPALIDLLYKLTLRPKLVQPCFLMHHPTEMVPLARRNTENPRILDMFQVVVNTWEIVKAYSELVDPVDQRERMEGQQDLRDQGDDETMMMENDFIECMEYGMPPMSGLGLGIDRLVALLTNVDSLRDTVFFPNMRGRSPS